MLIDFRFQRTCLDRLTWKQMLIGMMFVFIRKRFIVNSRRDIDNTVKHLFWAGKWLTLENWSLGGSIIQLTLGVLNFSEVLQNHFSHKLYSYWPWQKCFCYWQSKVKSNEIACVQLLSITKAMQVFQKYIYIFFFSSLIYASSSIFKLLFSTKKSLVVEIG